MYKSFDMIILTRSSKFHNYCVAGIDIATGKLVRLITDSDKTHGALTYRDLIMDNGCNANALDVVRVKNAQHCPGSIQKENYIINRSIKLQYIRTVLPQEAIQCCSMPSRKKVFDSDEPKIQNMKARELGRSLELLHVTQLKVYTEIINGKYRTKADFCIGGKSFKKYSVTDPQYYGNDGDVNSIAEAFIVCSIAEDQWAIDNGYYVFISAIYPYFSNTSVKKKQTIGNDAKPENAGKPWLPGDDERLLAMYRSGVSVNTLTEQFKRTKVAIQARLVKNGIAEDISSVPEVFAGDDFELPF